MLFVVRTTKVIVQSQHLDSFGHLNHAVYLNFLEGARCDYMEQAGISFNRGLEEGAFCVVLRVEIDYLTAALCGDEIEILMTPERREELLAAIAIATSARVGDADSDIRTRTQIIDTIDSD